MRDPMIAKAVRLGKANFNVRASRPHELELHVNGSMANLKMTTTLLKKPIRKAR